MAAAAAIPVLLSIDDYLDTSYRPDVDFVDGYIEERNLGEFDHARLQFKLAAFFDGKEKLWGIQGVTEQRIRVSPTRVRIADLALLDDAGLDLGVSIGREQADCLPGGAPVSKAEHLGRVETVAVGETRPHPLHRA